MRPALPTRLGTEFWFALVMIVAGLAGVSLALSWGWWFQTVAGCLISVIFVVRLISRVRAVRLGKSLALDPEMAKRYYGTGAYKPPVP